MCTNGNTQTYDHLELECEECLLTLDNDGGIRFDNFPPFVDDEGETRCVLQDCAKVSSDK